MKIEICIGEEHEVLYPDYSGYEVSYIPDVEVDYEHDSYCDSIDEAIERLLELKRREEEGLI